MSSQNIDQNAMLKYICFCLQIWGVNYLTKQTLKKSKQNSPESCRPLTRLLFDLAILQIVDFSYTLPELGIRVGEDQQGMHFIEEFVLAYLSESGCPYLGDGLGQGQGGHGLDFGEARGLMLVVGWLMARVDFFGQIKNKYINRKFTELYIQRKPKMGNKEKLGSLGNKQNRMKPYNSQPQSQPLQKLYKTLLSHEHRIHCLTQKKSQILSKLTKQLTQYNKKNQTNYKIQNLLSQQSQDNDEEIGREEDELEVVLGELGRGMKNVGYFWMWLQFKVGDLEFKDLEGRFEEFQRVEGEKVGRFVRMNPDYLATYTKHYNTISTRLQQLNTTMSTLEPQLQSIKPPKNEAAIVKQVHHDAEKMLRLESPQLAEIIGMPCFLKLEVRNYMERHGFGARGKRKGKKKEIQGEVSEGIGDRLKEEIGQFIQKLEQIKFL